jgi:hypothetical protein
MSVEEILIGETLTSMAALPFLSVVPYDGMVLLSSLLRIRAATERYGDLLRLANPEPGRERMMKFVRERRRSGQYQFGMSRNASMPRMK